MSPPLQTKAVAPLHYKTLATILCATTLHVMVLPACGASRNRRAPIPPEAYPGELSDPGVIGPDVLAEQIIVGAFTDPATREEKSFEYHVVLQKSEGTLLLLALTPFKTRLFSISHRGGKDFKVEVFLEAQLFPPRFILQDVYRALQVRDGGLCRGATEHTYDYEGDRVSDICVRSTEKNTQLVERRITRRSGKPAGNITISYPHGREAERIPEQINIHNAWLGYTITIQTVSQQRL